MKRFQAFTTVVVVLSGTALLAPTLQARTCTGNGDVIGSYAFFGSRAGYFLLGATPPGTVSGPLVPIGVTPPATTAALFGVNPWSKFIQNLSGNAAFNAAGRIFADGAGNLFAGDSTSFLLTNTLVGTYTVNTDCSVTMSIRDPFPVTTGGPITTVGGPSITLEGEIIDGRIEAVVTNANAAGAIVTFVKTAQFNSCSNASISGNFGVVGTGVVVPGAILPPTTPLTTGGGGVVGGTTLLGGAFASGAITPLGTAFNLLGRFNADGAGKLSPDPVGNPSPLKRTITGTYTVNVDCTGTANLIDTTGLTRNIFFVLLNETTVSAGTVGSTSQQSMRFIFTDTGVIGSGSAVLQ